jgi:hypothetical protein
MRAAAAIALLLTLFVAVPGAAQAPDGTPYTCGTKRLYGHKLLIRVRGERLACSKVREVIRGRCHEGRTWSCFSFWPPSPVLVWFREKDRFKETWSIAIEGVRYPCSEAGVTARSWRAARRESHPGFPNRQQVIADDVIRCHVLRGKSYKQVVKLLGRGDFHGRDHGRRYLDWVLGDERDSFFQIDSESLSVEIDRDGKVRSAELAQD